MIIAANALIVISLLAVIISLCIRLMGAPSWYNAAQETAHRAILILVVGIILRLLA